jgi:hypothetical protein
MARKPKTDELSEEAKRIMLAGFTAGRTALWLIGAVKEATGEAVSERTMARRAAEWRGARDQFERAKDNFRAMKEAGLDGGQMIEALAFEQLLTDPTKLTGADPIKFHGLGIESKKVALKEREVAAKERALAIDERRIAMVEAREARAVAVLGVDKPELSAEERLREIREIYGLRN